MDLDRMFQETMATSAKVGARVNAHTDRKTAEIQETTAKVGARVNAHTDRRTAEIQETTAKVGARVNAHTDRKAAEIQETTAKVGARVNAHSDANHAETRNTIRNESNRIIGAMDNDNLGFGLGLIAFICALIAGVGTFLAERGVVLKPVLDQTNGNVLRYIPDTWSLVIVSFAVFVLTFCVVGWLGKKIRKHIH